MQFIDTLWKISHDLVKGSDYKICISTEDEI